MGSGPVQKLANILLLIKCTEKHLKLYKSIQYIIKHERGKNTIFCVFICHYESDINKKKYVKYNNSAKSGANRVIGAPDTDLPR